MFFAPALRNGSAATRPGALDTGFDRFIQDAFGIGRGLQDIQEDDHGWTVSLDVPGVSREQLAVKVEGSTVRVETVPEAARRYHALYELPREVDPQACEAKLQDGVLTLRLAKAQSATARRIEVS
ncbi:MAG TPA: Hsp20/alpha crystallin family protein [Ramlibacter sp.]